MLGETVKALREKRSWSQAHLAQASCVNIRTIQRLEADEPCAPETLLAIAGALDVDVRALAGNGFGESAPRPWVEPRRAALLGALTAAPCILFVAVNLLKYGLGLSSRYDALAGTGAALMSFETFDAVSPFLFLGGGAVSLLLCLAATVRPKTSRSGGVLTVTGIDVRFSVAAFTVMLLALAALGVLLAYGAAEEIATLASR